MCYSELFLLLLFLLTSNVTASKGLCGFFFFFFLWLFLLLFSVFLGLGGGGGGGGSTISNTLLKKHRFYFSHAHMFSASQYK